MNWHCHAGIFTYPMQIAIKYRIPLVFWGEHGFTEHGGMAAQAFEHPGSSYWTGTGAGDAHPPPICFS